MAQLKGIDEDGFAEVWSVTWASDGGAEGSKDGEEDEMDGSVGFDGDAEAQNFSLSDGDNDNDGVIEGIRDG